MESSGTPSAISYQWAGYGSHNQLASRNEVIDAISRAPVKVRHWLLSNVTFQAGLEALNPASSAWMNDEKVRSLIKAGLISMVECAVDFVSAFPDAQIPKV